MISIIIILTLLWIITEASDLNQTCHPFQTFDQPRVLPLQKYCNLYQNNSCCDSGTAKRAYNWAYDDDGCGIVYGECLRLSVDIACYLNCSPNMTMKKVNTFTGDTYRPVIPEQWAQKIYNACISYSWCGTSQFLTSTCTAFQIKTQHTYKSSVDVLIKVDKWDTCSSVSDMNLEEFVDNILDVAIDYDNNVTEPIRQTLVNLSFSSYNINNILTILLMCLTILYYHLF
jgi:hypothetical protein